MTSSYSTPAFSWSLGEEEKEKAPTPTIQNPLLKQPFRGTEHRFPFSPLQQQQQGLRQRTNTKEQTQPATTTIKQTPVLPPKESLLTGATPTRTNVGISSEATPLNNTSDSSSLNNRWVVVHGYATEAQYHLILSKFSSFGKIVSHKGSCRPGQQNWIALEYSSSLETEKALSQSSLLLENGILVGVVRLTPFLKQSLEWNTAASVVAPSVKSRLFADDEYELTEKDILFMASPQAKAKPLNMGGTEGRNVFERFLVWYFGW